MSRRERTVEIHTPEGISFSLTLASPVVRFLAWVLDAAVAAGITAAMSKVLELFGAFALDVAAALNTVAYFVLSIGYGIFFEWRWNGQTPGKKLLRLRGMDVDGLRLQCSQVAVRNLLRAVDMLPVAYLVGGATALLSGRSQRLGDVAANTMVVQLASASDRDIEQLATRKYNSLAEQRPLALRLRNHVKPELAALAVRAIESRERLTPLARVAVFSELADAFRALVKFPEEVTSSLTDEQYVRNAVEIAFGLDRRAR
jgi:uncharacterized RDD family membrane protein YckC